MKSSRVEAHRFNGWDTADEPNAELPGITADFAVFDILLKASAARIYTDCGSFAAIRTGYFSRSLRRSVAEREFIIEMIVGHSLF